MIDDFQPLSEENSHLFSSVGVFDYRSVPLEKRDSSYEFINPYLIFIGIHQRIFLYEGIIDVRET